MLATVFGPILRCPETVFGGRELVETVRLAILCRMDWQMGRTVGFRNQKGVSWIWGFVGFRIWANL